MSRRKCEHAEAGGKVTSRCLEVGNPAARVAFPWPRSLRGPVSGQDVGRVV